MRLLSSLVLAALILTAQQSPTQPPSTQPPPNPASDESSPTFRSDTRLVVLPVSVADKNGKLVTNLSQQSFKVFENGAEQPIKIFRREDVPVSLGIVIDNSGSMRDKRQKV